MGARLDLAGAKDRAGQALEDAARSTWMERVARWGLIVRGALYVIVAILALQVATGDRAERADRDGALQAVARQPLGRVLLLALAAGFAGYAVWRFVETVVGPPEEKDGRRALAKRALCGLRGLLYTSFFVSTLQLGLSSRAADGGGSESSESDWTARILDWPAGKALVILAGMVVIVVGLCLAWQGLSRGFEDKFKQAEMTRGQHRAVVVTGAIGMTARSVLAVLIGIFLIIAATHRDPNQAVGVDGALKRLAGRTWGPYVLVAVAAGLAAYGLYSLAEARFRRVGDG